VTTVVTITGKVVIGGTEYPVETQVELPDPAPAPLRDRQPAAR
jgi:hypothetical protein